MTSPFRTPFFERRNDCNPTVLEDSPPSPPLGLKFAWKTPVLLEHSDKFILPPREDENEAEAESSTQLPALPPLHWKAPVIRAPPKQSRVDEEDEFEEAIEQTRSPIPPPLSSSLALDDDQGDFELESVLLEEEEYSVAEYNRHRKETGLAYLDDLFTVETHASLQEGDGQRGLACGSALEVAGTPGSGKTSILIQMAIRERMNGLIRAREKLIEKVREKEEVWMDCCDIAPQVLLIDTEGGIGIDRIVNIARGQIAKLDSTLQTSTSALLRSILAGIHYCRCTNETDLLALFKTLLPISKRRHFASTKNDKKDLKADFDSNLPLRSSMILIDTISYLVRASLADEARQLRNQRTRLINELKHFVERCSRRGINVVLSNQMSFTMVDKEGYTRNLSDKEGEGRFVPLLRNQRHSILGPDIWRLLLFRAGNHDVKACSHFAHLLGHPLIVSQVVEKLPLDWLRLQFDPNGVTALPSLSR